MSTSRNTAAPQRPMTTYEAPRKRYFRRFLQFRLRTLLVIITLTAVGLSCYYGYIEPYGRQHEAGLALAGKGVSMEWRSARPAWLVAVLGLAIDRAVLQDCVAVHAEHAGLKDDDLVHLRQMPQLRRLYLARNPISDKGLEHLVGLQRLERLSLWGTNITDDGLRHVGQLSALRVLDIHNGDGPFFCGSQQTGGWALEGRYPRIVPDRPTGACLTYLHGLNNLRTMHFSFPLYNDGLAQLATFESLRVRTLVLNNVTPTGLSHLPHFRELETLVIVRSTAGSDGLRPLAHLPNLRWLELRSVQVADDGWQPLGELPRLEELSVIASFMGDSGLKSLRGLRSLQKLSLRGNGISDQSVAHLAGLANLRELDLSFEFLTADALNGLKNMDQLERLGLHVRLDDEAVHSLAQMPKLTKLFGPKRNALFECYLTDAGLADLAKLRCLPGVKISDAVAGATLAGVDVPANPGTLTDAGLARLWDTPGFEQLTVSGRDLTTAGLCWKPELADMRYLQVTSERSLSEVISGKLEIGAGSAEFYSHGIGLVAEAGLGPQRVNLSYKGDDCQLDVLQYVPKIRRLKLAANRRPTSPGCDWDKLRFVPRLETFEMPADHLRNARIDAVGLRRLGEMEGLRRLVCSLPDNISPDELSPLANLKKLEYLELYGAGLTAEHIRHLAQLSNLGILNIHGPPPAGDLSIGAHFLANHQHLTELQLYGVTDEDMPALGKLKRLYRLTLKDHRISDEAFEHLSKLSALRYLTLDAKGMEAARLKQIAGRLPGVVVRVN